jgi:hypothetical protein
MLTLAELRVKELEAKQAVLLQELQEMKSRMLQKFDEKSPTKVVCFRK